MPFHKMRGWLLAFRDHETCGLAHDASEADESGFVVYQICAPFAIGSLTVLPDHAARFKERFAAVALNAGDRVAPKMEIRATRSDAERMVPDVDGDRFKFFWHFVRPNIFGGAVLAPLGWCLVLADLDQAAET